MQIYICINIEKVNKEVQGGLLYCMCLCVTCQEIKCLKHEWLQTPINNKYRIPSDFFSLFFLFSFSAYALICLLYSICMHVRRTYIWVCMCVCVLEKFTLLRVCTSHFIFAVSLFAVLLHAYIHSLILLYVPKRINQSYLYIYEYPVLCTANKQYRNPKE